MQHARCHFLLILWIPLAALCAPQDPDLSATQLTPAPGFQGKVLAFDAFGRIFSASSIAPPTGKSFSAATFAPDGRVWVASPAFIGRLNAAGTAWDWLIDQKVDQISGIAADAKGAVYEVGRIGGHMWIAKFDGGAPSPVLAWQKTFGGAGNEAGNAVATDGGTGIYLTGWSDSQDWGAPGRAAGRHAFVLKLNAADGSPQYLHWFAEGADAEGLGIALMPDLSVIVTGRTGLGGFPSTSGFARETCEPNSAFFARVNPAGDGLVYSGCLSGDGQQDARIVALDTQGNAWVAGSTTSSRFAGEESLPGMRRAWIAKVSADGSSLEFVKGMAAMAPAGIDKIAADPAGDGAFAAGSIGEEGEGAEQKPLLLRAGPSASDAALMQVHASSSTSASSAHTAATAVPMASSDPLSQTITFDAIPNQIFGISPFPVAAQSSALLPVRFTVTTPAVCRISDDLVMLLKAGTCSITASQPGNATYSAATPVTQSFTVTRARVSTTFAEVTGSPFQVGIQPTSVVVGYFNGDSAPDLATANDGSGNVTVLLGTGTGSFAPAASSPFTAGTTPHALAVGDFNGAGDPGLVAANENGDSLTVLLGNRAGGFAPAVASPFAASPVGVVVGDFNGDGIQDLATASLGGNAISVMLGNGLDGFTPATGSPFTVGNDPYAVAVGDFNGDGFQDLATANLLDNTVTVLLGNGLAGFTPATGSPFTVGDYPYALAVGDFNGDGFQDLATANLVDDTVTVLLGDGKAGFSPAPGSPFAVGTSPSSVVVADFNGDGIPDLVTANYRSNNVTVLLGNGSGGFAPAPGSPFAVGTAPQSVAVADFNGDGIEDLAVANNGGNNVTVLLGSVGVPQAIIFLPLIYSVSPFAISATATSLLKVSFVSSTPAVCTVSGTTVTIVGGGTCSIVASQGGNATYAPAATVTQSFTAPASQIITFGSLLDQSLGVAVAHTANLSWTASTTPNVTYNVYRAAASTGPFTTPLNSSPIMGTTYTDTSVQAGQAYYYVTTAVASNGTQSAASNAVPVTIPSLLTAGATASSGLGVKLVSNNLSVCTISGVTITVVGVGICSITASQPGNLKFAAASPVTRTFTVHEPPPTIVSLSPSTGTGTSVTFQAVYADPLGAGDLGTVLLQINSTQNSADACYVFYQPQGNHLYLANNSGAWITPALTPGAPGTAANSQCTLNAGSSSVKTAGNNLTLGVALSFSGAIVGSRNVYLYAAGLAGQNTGWVKEGMWVPTSAGPPAILSLSPIAGAGTSVTFQAVYSDPNGAADLNTVLLQINSSQNSANACYVYYQPQGNHLYLADNTGAWITPSLTPGMPGTVSNSQCSLDAGSSSVTSAGNNLTLSVALSFNSAFVSSRNVYLYASGFSGQNSGWVMEGTWTPNPIAEPPAIVLVSPTSGVGASVTFQAVYADPNGARDLNTVLLLINTSQSGANACYVSYQPQGNHLYLATNAGTAWLTPALTPGVAGTVSNSQCTLNAGSSSVTMAGNNLTLKAALSFNSTFVGVRNVYTYATGFSGLNSGWVKEGAWTPHPIAVPPAIVSLSPNSGTGPSVTLQAVYSDPNGAADLNTVLLQINTTQNSANACYVYYQPQGNNLYLANNAGAWITPALTPGAAGTASNSQCSLNAGSSSVTMAGNDLTLRVALSFSGTLTGSKNTYLYAAGLSGQNSGWVREGTWVPASAGPPAIVSLTPNSGAGTSVTLQAVYSDPNGAADLSELLLEVNGSQSGGNACYVYYQPQGNLLYLATDAGAWITPGLTPGVAGTVSNSQCTLNAGSSSVTTSGIDLTLHVALTSGETFVGAKNVYLYAAGLSGQNTGWVRAGTWTP
jgi:hypothetical protein